MVAMVSRSPWCVTSRSASPVWDGGRPVVVDLPMASEYVPLAQMVGIVVLLVAVNLLIVWAWALAIGVLPRHER